MLRAALISSFAFGLVLTGCGGTDAQVAPSPETGTTQEALLFGQRQCDAPVVHQEGGTYAKLSDTGLYCNIASGTLDANARFFAPEIALWSDGADKSRYMRLPPETKIDTTDMDHWVFPVGMKVWKEFRVNGRKIETRLLEKRADGSWLMVPFQWNEKQSEAFPVPDGVLNANGTRHDIPSTAQCQECHGTPTDALIGVSPLMLARASPWGVTLFELTWRNKLTQNPDRPIQFPGDYNTRRALAYLYANCTSCHRGATAPAGLDLSTSVKDARPEDTAVYRTAVNQALTGWLDHGYTMRVAPGSVAQSAVIARMSTRVPGNQMPEIATKVIDPWGIAIVSEWIEHLPGPRR